VQQTGIPLQIFSEILPIDPGAHPETSLQVQLFVARNVFFMAHHEDDAIESRVNRESARK
jgi:hypothetical protein